MLVLERKPSQSISIGDDVRVTVVRTKRGSLRLGVVAPPHLRILRSEIKDNKPAAELGLAIRTVISTCRELFGDVDSMPPTVAELFQLANECRRELIAGGESELVAAA